MFEFAAPNVVVLRIRVFMCGYPADPVSDSCNVCHNVLALTCALVCLCRWRGLNDD